MSELLQVGAANLLSPMVLFFALGFAAAMVKSDLAVPEAIAKGMALYLMLAIGFKGGVALREQGLQATVILTLLAGIVLSFVIPVIAFALLRALGGVGRIDAAAIAAHYGSISVVTFVAATQMLRVIGMDYEGFMVAVMAVMETPAILVGLWLARNGQATAPDGASRGLDAELWREIFFNGSVLLLTGSFVIGLVTGNEGFVAIAPFIEGPFKGVLCLFLLDMGLVAAARWRGARLGPGLFAFGLIMPVVGASLGIAAGALIGLGTAEMALLAVLCGSASYIAVPAAMRLALPEASPTFYLTLSLAVTFPFNLTVGIPLYLTFARWVTGG